MAERLLTVADLEGLTGIPAGTWAQYRYQGQGPRFIKIGRHIRYRSDEVESWIAAHERGGDDRPSAA